MSIILAICNNKVLIYSIKSTHTSLLKKLGSKRKLFKRSQWILPYSTKLELAKYLNELRNANFLFSGGGGWTPSAVFQDLRDHNYITGKIKEAVWIKPESKVIREI
ncbi:MAG: hypothetical protein KIT27_11290 [Legionellales bacterium]|nr:hypothetical protein [Legionellales bacterium]